MRPACSRPCRSSSDSSSNRGVSQLTSSSSILLSNHRPIERGTINGRIGSSAWGSPRAVRHASCRAAARGSAHGISPPSFFGRAEAAPSPCPERRYTRATLCARNARSVPLAAPSSELQCWPSSLPNKPSEVPPLQRLLLRSGGPHVRVVSRLEPLTGRRSPAGAEVIRRQKAARRAL